MVTLRFQSCLTYRMFKQKDSVLNTSAISVVTKSSMKPRSGTTTNHHLHGSGERNGDQRKTKVSFGRTMMRALSCSGWQKGTARDEMMLNSEEIKPIYNFSVYQVTLV